MDVAVKKLKENESSATDDDESLGQNVSKSNEEEDENEMTEKKNLTMEKVFQIPSVVEQIIGGLQDLSDLKACRRVSSMWKETTTKLMLKRNSALVPLIFHDGSKKYKKFIHWHLHRYYFYYKLDRSFKYQYIVDCPDLTDLKTIVSKSTPFPCSTFVMFQGDLSDLKLKDFLEVVGTSIRHLKLIRINGKTEKLKVVLGLNCPNLETLHMQECNMKWSPKDISFELPKLNMLHMTENYLYKKEDEEDSERVSVFKILKTLNAPNLQVIKGFHVSKDLEAVTEAGKINRVKDLTCKAEHPDDLIKFDMFLQTGPQLQDLKLVLSNSLFSMNPAEKSSWISLIQNLFELSKTTLKSISFRGIKNVFTNIHIPQLSKFRQIEFDPFREGVRYPNEILNDNISPNLQVIKEFDMFKDLQEVLRERKVHCVKELNFLEEPKLTDLSLFLSASPQLESFKISWIWGRETEKSDWTTEFSGLLEQLLELSKDTLRSFQFNGVGAGLENVKFPAFPKLQHVHIAAKPVRIFPRGINLTETFPKLEILDLHESNCFDDKWDTWFPPLDAFTGSLSCVTTLIVHKHLSNDTVRKLRTICPNAKVVFSN